MDVNKHERLSNITLCKGKTFLLLFYILQSVVFSTMTDNKEFVTAPNLQLRATLLLLPINATLINTCMCTSNVCIHFLSGNYVATIESKHSRKKDFYSVKVYLNWEIATSKSKQKTSVRLAGKDHTVKASSIEDSYIQVIDVPYQFKVESINVCQRTGNFITVCKEITFIYHLVEKTISNSDKVYLDVVLFLQLEWHIGQILKTVICEDFIGVLSKKQVQVVKVVYSDENTGRSPSLSGRGFGNHRRKPSSVISNFSFSPKNSLSLPDTPQFSRIGCRSSANASPSLSTTKSYDSFSCIKDDEHLLKVNLDDLKTNEGQPSNKGIKTIYLKNLQENYADKAAEPIVIDLRGWSLKNTFFFSIYVA